MLDQKKSSCCVCVCVCACMCVCTLLVGERQQKERKTFFEGRTWNNLGGWKIVYWTKFKYLNCFLKEFQKVKL